VTVDRASLRTRSARRLPLLLLAILIPSATVLALGLKTTRQERELAEKRQADARARALTDARQTLLTRLERARLAELSGSHDSAIAFALPVDSLGRITAPWKADDNVREFIRDREAPSFAKRLAIAERAVHQAHDSAAAETLYARARRATSNDALAAFIELQAIHVAPRSAARTDRMVRLADLTFDADDEFGVPIALYAARQLELEREVANVSWSDLARRVQERLASNRLSSNACQLAQTVLAAAPNSVGKREAPERTAERCVELDALDDLASSPALSRLATADASASPAWSWWARPSWFVSIAQSGGKRMFVAIRGGAIFRGLDDAGIKMTMANADRGTPLGGPFVDTFVSVASPLERVEGAPLRGWFYAAGLVLLVGLTTAAAYLLWRDVRRELALGAVRAEFVSSVSHELRTPLTAIRMYADTLLTHRGLDDQVRNSYLSTIVGESERLTRLLNNVLDFARIERNAKMYTMRRVDLAQIVRDAARMMAHPLAEQGFTLTLQGASADASVAVVADADAIAQAVLNLIVNAMKYSGDARTIALTLDVSDGEATIAVTDQGIGIPTDECERIFERFYRVASRDGTSQPGAGLGLTIVRHAVLAHGGRIVVRSALGEGSTFAMHLPLADHSPSVSAGRTQREVVPG